MLRERLPAQVYIHVGGKKAWVWLAEGCLVMLQVDFVVIWRVCQCCECASVHVCVAAALTHRGMTKECRSLVGLSHCYQQSLLVYPSQDVKFADHCIIIVLQWQILSAIHSLAFHLVPFWVSFNQHVVSEECILETNSMRLEADVGCSLWNFALMLSSAYLLLAEQVKSLCEGGKWRSRVKECSRQHQVIP